jgi:hypothetical protein
MPPRSEKEIFQMIGSYLNHKCEPYNFRVAEALPLGKNAKVSTNTREFRIQLINKNSDTSDEMKIALPKILQQNELVKNVKFYQLSKNSSKYSSVSFTFNDKNFDVIISKGANKGETFEQNTVKQLQSALHVSSDSYAELLKLLIKANSEFSKNELVSVEQRTGSTKKENVPIEKLGSVIGDIVIKDSLNKDWFISLKDINGDTFSSYSGAASLFDSQGGVQPNSEGAKFLWSFSVDLNQVQSGFDIRNKKTAFRKPIKNQFNKGNLVNIFKRAWGMNYFYVRRISNGWKVFWLDSNKLNSLVTNIRIDDIKYPTLQSKQITISCSNQYAKYKIEVRNSKGGEYPNDIKFKIAQLK